MSSSISSVTNGSFSISAPMQAQPLSEQQKSLITSTLSNYDPQDLSASDASAIVKTFADAGIRPGGALAQAMGQMGFNARQVGQLGGASANQPPASQSGQGAAPLSEQQQNLVASTLSNYDPQNLSASDASAIVQALSGAGIQPGAALAQAMGKLGFNAGQVGALGGAQGPGSSSTSSLGSAVNVKV